MGSRHPVVVGIMYPPEWEARPQHEHTADIDTLAGIDSCLEVIHCGYVDPGDLRTQRGSSPDADLRHLAPPVTDEQREALARVEIVLTQDLPFDVGQLAPNLRWVQGMGAGVSQLLSAGLAEAGIRLTTAAGSNAVSISEFVVARLLQVWKRLPDIQQAQSEHRWYSAYGKEVAGSVIGIVGLGAIGREVARKARGLGMTVLASRRSAQPGQIDPDVDQLFGPGELHAMLAGCDAVVASVPETADTVDLFDRAAFAAMRSGAIFCNVGRGTAVVEDDLVDALSSGQLAAAALDVVHDEPLSSASPLWDVPKLYISGHSATSPDKFWSNMHALFRDNVVRYLDGEPLHNEVDARLGR